jgi:hypothetical protein
MVVSEPDCEEQVGEQTCSFGMANDVSSKLNESSSCIALLCRLFLRESIRLATPAVKVAMLQQFTVNEMASFVQTTVFRLQNNFLTDSNT